MTDIAIIGASGLRAYAQALATISDNVANAQTEGYARRTVRLEEHRPTGDAIFYRNQAGGNGVSVGGIVRSVDIWLVEDARHSGAQAQQSQARLTWMEAVERALDDGPTGLGSSLTAMFNAADQLTTNPESTVLRRKFIASVENIAAAFRQTASQLSSASDGIVKTATSVVADVNGDAASLAKINEGLLRAREGSANQAALLDQRDMLIDRISDNVPVTIDYDAKGGATVRVPALGDALLVSGTASNRLDMHVDLDRQITFSTENGTPSTFAAVSGRLAGLSAASVDVATNIGRLDVMAVDVADRLNQAHMAGFDSSGLPGQPLFVVSGGAGSVQAVLLGPDDVAVADSMAANGNFLGFASARGAGGLESGWADSVAQHSQAVASARAENNAAIMRRDASAAARDTASGVDLDQEAAELLRFQQAYEGSARVIQVAREIFQSILNAI